MANDFAVVTTKGGETLLDIATRYTLDPSYYVAIGNYNGFDDFQVSPSYRFPAGESIAIPKNWMKPAYQATMPSGPTVSRPGSFSVSVTGGNRIPTIQQPGFLGLTTNQMLMIGGVILALALLAGSPRRR